MTERFDVVCIARKALYKCSACKGRKVTAAGWQVTITLCDPIWHVISRSGEMISTNCSTLLLLTYIIQVGSG